jgi:hypothetical protein
MSIARKSLILLGFRCHIMTYCDIRGIDARSTRADLAPGKRSATHAARRRRRTQIAQATRAP